MNAGTAAVTGHRTGALLGREGWGNVLSVAAALYGVAIAAALLTVWLRPAPKGQLPAYMTARNLDANASYHYFLGLVVVPLLAALLFGPVLRRFADADSRPWARNAALLAVITSLWYVSIDGNLLWTALPAACTVAVVFALRRLPMEFSRRDAALIPAFASIFVALADLTGTMSVERVAILAGAMTFAVRIAVALLRRRSGLEAPLCFAAAPLALFLQSHVFGHERYFGWPPLAICIVSPLLLRLTLNDGAVMRRRLIAALAFFLYPLAAFSYSSAVSIFTTEGMPRISFFEEAQHLVPASEMLRGETPYRDIIPPHGLIQDALFDYAAMRVQGWRSIGRVVKFRGVVAGLANASLYAVGAAVTGSPHAAVAVTFIGFLFGVSSVPLRFLPAVIVVALLGAALRRRSERMLTAAGVIAVLGVVTSVDFGAYSLAAIAIVLIRFPDRKRAAIAAAKGVAAAGIAVALAFLVGGILVDAIRTTVSEVLTLGPVYALDPRGGKSMSLARPFPEVLGTVFEQQSQLVMLWVATVVGLVAFIGHRGRMTERRRRTIDPLFAVAAYVVLTGAAFAERLHMNFSILTPILMFGAAWHLWRRRRVPERAAAVALAFVFVVSAGFTSHVAIAAALRRTSGPIEKGLVEIDSVPRARGGYFQENERTTVEAVDRYVRAHLAPNETFFDFTNHGLLYFLLKRDCPIRQIEVAFYETPERQRDVIRRIDSNPLIRAALMPPDDDDQTMVDGVPNRERAPLVWQYLEQHFEPAAEAGDVTIWRRK